MKKGRDLKPHIGIFGRRNNGKSSFINLITAQDVAIVSDHPGTTTDPVKKSVEIFGIGPAIIIDTAGIDDSGELGMKRVEKSLEVIQHIDLAILLIAGNCFGEHELELVKQFRYYETNFLVVHNKSDLEVLNAESLVKIEPMAPAAVMDINTLDDTHLESITANIKSAMPRTAFVKPSLFEGLIKPKDLVLLVTPIDSEAPEGRMILPQVMALRDALDQHCICVIVRETELADFLKLGIKPALAVTDSQAFDQVSKLIDRSIPLTGFSILFARLRADFNKYLQGTSHISKLQDGDRLLILESCTHHVSCEDIGRNKLPAWLAAFTGKVLEVDVIPGLQAIERDIRDYAMVIQCGGCMVTRKQLCNRLKPAIDAGVAVSNYGMAIAYVNGIFERATAPFVLSGEFKTEDSLSLA